MPLGLEQLKRISLYLLNGRLDHIQYRLWERVKGLDFTPASIESLGLSHERSVYHLASDGVFLADILKQIDIPRGSRVVDLGCGKGSALCTFGRFPFEEVAGVEISEALARIAERNCQKLKIQNASIYVADAGKFTELDRFSHVYMFNPFPQMVVAEVMQNIAASLVRAPRRLTVIYSNPSCSSTVTQTGLFNRSTQIQIKFGRPCGIYVHDDPHTGRW